MFVKAFFHPLRAKSHAEREVRASRMLREKGLPVPDILGQTLATIQHDGTENVPAEVVIFEHLPDATTLQEELNATADPSSILHDAWSLMKQLSDAGFHHTDPHLGNFIYSKGCLHLVDCGAIIRSSGFVRRFRKRKGLALFLAQFDPDHDARMEALSGIDKELVVATRRTERDRFFRKMLRECSRIEVLKNDGRGELYVTRTKANTEILRVIASSELARLSDETTLGLGVTTIEFSDSRAAQRSWCTAQYLSQRVSNIPTPIALEGRTILIPSQALPEEGSIACASIEDLHARLSCFGFLIEIEELRGLLAKSETMPILSRCDQLRLG